MRIVPPSISQGLGHTRGDKRLDYILIACPLQPITRGESVSTLADITLSDHLPLSFVAEVQAYRTPPTKTTKERAIKKGLKMRDYERILLSPLWPRLPFIEVAKQLGLTSMMRVKQNDLHHLEKDIKIVEKC